MANKSKYHAKKVTIDGITFASTKEGNRYKELSLLQRAGKISNLQTQVRFELIPPQYAEVTEYSPKTHKPKTVKKLVERKCDYLADFVYLDENGNLVVEDAKGYTRGEAYKLFVLKRKLMLYIHNIKVREV